MLRVYYDGADRQRDAEVSARLTDWLLANQIDLVATERVLDPEPFVRWKARHPDGLLLLLPPPEGMAGVAPADAALGYRPYERRKERGEMGDEVRRAFTMWLDADLGSPQDLGIPGLSRVSDGQPEAPQRSLLEARGPALDFRPVVEHDEIAAAGDTAIAPAPYTIFGNGGCPYSRDVSQAKPYRDLALLEDSELLRKGCAFCTMGGDYDKRSDDETVASLLRQVTYLIEHLPKPHAFVLTDQHPLRYLPKLLERAEAHGLREVTWLLETRADWLVEHHTALARSIEVAARTDTRLELYLIGFESFSDDDLERYNKGTTRDVLLAAVELVRDLARAHPLHFGYSAERGHSLILFHPWTSPESLLESGRAVREHGLTDFFHDITRNRLRLYPRLPIYALAKSEGLVAEDWQGAAASQTARSKGYSVDIAWQFADRRAAIAYETCRRLRSVLGGETETSQLIAASQWVQRLAIGDTPEVEDVTRGIAADLDALANSFDALLRGSCGDRAATVLFAGSCNNACNGCENRDRFLPDDVNALRERVDAARRQDLPLMLAGREPTLHPEFVALIARARGADGRRVGVVSNGRRFAYGKFTAEAVRAGLTDASIKVFAARATEADAIARVDGAFEQAMKGIANLRRAGARVEMRVPLHASALATLPELAAVAAATGVSTIRVEAALASLGLDALGEAVGALRRLATACRESGIHLAAAPLPSGMRGFDRLPA